MNCPTSHSAGAGCRLRVCAAGSCLRCGRATSPTPRRDLTCAVTAQERAPKHPLPYELSPASGPGRPGHHSRRCPSLVTAIPPSHPCSSASSAQTLLSLKSQGTATSFPSGKGEAALSRLRGWDDRAVPNGALQKTPCG